MSRGLFLVLYGVILGSLGLGVPFRAGPPDRGRGPTPRPGSPPRCLRLEWSPEARQRYGGHLPSHMRLDPDTAWRQGEMRAEGSPEFGLWHYAGWQPAGPDSLDIRWHHSPLVRLPARGPHAVGYAAETWPTPLLLHLLAPAPVTVAATDVPCPSGDRAPT